MQLCGELLYWCVGFGSSAHASIMFACYCYVNLCPLFAPVHTRVMQLYALADVKSSPRVISGPSCATSWSTWSRNRTNPISCYGLDVDPFYFMYHTEIYHQSNSCSPVSLVPVVVSDSKTRTYSPPALFNIVYPYISQMVRLFNPCLTLIQQLLKSYQITRLCVVFMLCPRKKWTSLNCVLHESEDRQICKSCKRGRVYKDKTSVILVSSTV